MSSRALRRLQKEAALQEPSDEEGEVIIEKPSRAFNAFDLLDKGDDHVNEEESQEEERDTLAAAVKTAQATDVNEQDMDETTEEEAPPSQSQNKRRPPKKKKKKAKGKQPKRRDSEESLGSVDELLLKLAAANTKDKEHSTVAHDKGRQSAMDDGLRRKLLLVAYRQLDAEAEMKRMFGSRVVRQEQRVVSRLKSKMVLPKVDWPPFKRQGLSMELVETYQDVSYYTLKHSEEYQNVQMEFLSAVATFSPNPLMFLNQRYPYHIDCLLQLSEIAKASGDWTMAGDLIERAVYACERGLHPHFRFGTCTDQLAYRQSENRSFFLTMFRHVQFLERRGCWRTALEYTKLLLGLDPDDDPLGVLLQLDFYALSAREYSFLIDMATTWKTGGDIYPDSLLDLPNYAYSAAYAQWMLEPASAKGKKSSAMLQDAIQKFPAVVGYLLEMIGDNEHIFDDITIENPYLDLLQWLFVERNHGRWKEPEVTTWLKANARKVAQQGGMIGEKTPTLPMSAPLNVSRHVVLVDIQRLMGFLPQSVTDTSYHMYDPLPPPDSVSGYDMDERMRGYRSAWSATQGGESGGLLTALRQLLGGGVGRLQLPVDIMAQLRNLMNTPVVAEGMPGAFPGDAENDDSWDQESIIDDDFGEEIDEEEWQVQDALAETFEQQHNPPAPPEQDE